MPNEPELSVVMHNERELKFKWIEKRTWKSSIEKRIEEDRLYEVYKINKSRGVTTFRVNLISGASELMIQRLPSGTNYEEIKEEYLHKLSNFINTYSFQNMRLRRALKLIERSDEVEKRQMNFETISGEKVAFKSRDRNTDYTTNPSISNARNALGQNVSSSMGNVYWKPNSILTKSIHTHIYAKDNRVAILGQCVEREVNYVLSRIRHFSAG